MDLDPQQPNHPPFTPMQGFNTPATSHRKKFVRKNTSSGTPGPSQMPITFTFGPSNTSTSQSSNSGFSSTAPSNSFGNPPSNATNSGFGNQNTHATSSGFGSAFSNIGLSGFGGGMPSANVPANNNSFGFPTAASIIKDSATPSQNTNLFGVAPPQQSSTASSFSTNFTTRMSGSNNTNTNSLSSGLSNTSTFSGFNFGNTSTANPTLFGTTSNNITNSAPNTATMSSASAFSNFSGFGTSSEPPQTPVSGGSTAPSGFTFGASSFGNNGNSGTFGAFGTNGFNANNTSNGFPSFGSSTGSFPTTTVTASTTSESSTLSKSTAPSAPSISFNFSSSFSAPVVSETSKPTDNSSTNEVAETNVSVPEKKANTFNGFTGFSWTASNTQQNTSTPVSEPSTTTTFNIPTSVLSNSMAPTTTIPFGSFTTNVMTNKLSTSNLPTTTTDLVNTARSSDISTSSMKICDPTLSNEPNSIPSQLTDDQFLRIRRLNNDFHAQINTIMKRDPFVNLEIIFKEYSTYMTQIKSAIPSVTCNMMTKNGTTTSAPPIASQSH